MRKWLLSLALAAAVAASGLMVLAETPVDASACSGSCTMRVPTSGCLHWEIVNGWPVCTVQGGTVDTTTNCVLFGADPSAPCACPYERQGPPIVYNSCPDPKP